MNNFENENLTNNEQSLYQEIGTPRYYIEQIKKHLSQKQISAFIGAGFSKNANVKFPNWDELLEDMILELFDDEYKLYNSNNKDTFIKDKIKKIGYLEIVDKYINYKGMRESVDIYIEDYFDNIKPIPCESDLETHKKLLLLPWNNVYTTNYDDLLERTNNLINHDSKYKIIKEAKNLPGRISKRIIKLHGSLRTEKDKTEEKYGFDEDRNRNYIISKKDYDEYPEKHSGFTHLMRIALLQEAFCLIGFSANDPNFINWIDWVRDILKNDKDKKVFLISVEEEPLTKDRELYLSNLGIVNIFLNKVYDIKNNKKELINKFLLELEPYVNSKKVSNVLKENDELLTTVSIFVDLRESLLRQVIKNFPNNTNFKESIQKLKNRKNDFYIIPPKILTWSEQIISFLAIVIHKKFKETESDSVKIEILDILVTLIDYTNYTLDCLYSSENISDFENFVLEYKISLNDLENQIINNFYLLLAKSYRSQNMINKFMEFKDKISISNDKFIEMEILYEEILMNLINFKLDNAKILLEKFTVDEYPWLRVKKAFVSLNLGINSEEILKLFKEPIKDIGVQDETLIMDLSNRYDFGLNYERNLEYIEKVRTNKGLGYFDVNSIIDYYMKSEEFLKILPFNEKRYKVENTTSHHKKNVDNFYKNKSLFELFIKIGFPLRIKSYMNFSEKEFIRILDFEYLFDLNFIVFLILQYGGNDSYEKFVITCIQKIINRDDIDLKDKRVLLISIWSIFNNQLKTGKYERKLFFVISELTEISKYESWRKLFLETWTLSKSNDDFKNHLFSDVWGLIKPFSKILKYVSDEAVFEEILNEAYFAEDINSAFNLIEDILRYKTSFKLNENSRIIKYIEECINNKTITEDMLIKIYSLKKCLSTEILEKIKNIIFNMDSFSNLNVPFSFFPEDKQILEKLKHLMLSKKNFLLYSDINDGSHRNQRYFSIVNIISNKNMNWTQEELKEIYDNAEDSINKIENYYKVDRTDSLMYSLYLSIDTLLLKDIEVFLIFNKDKFEHLYDYNNVIKKGRKQLYELLGFLSLEDGLLDLNEDIRYKASNYYFGILRHIKSYHNPFAWKIIISRIIDFSDNRTEVALEGLSNYLLYFLKDEEWTKGYIDDYIAILKRLKNNFDLRFEKKLIKRSATKLAYVLQNYYKVDDEIVKFWITYKESSEYNEIVSMSLSN